jgi:dihydrofolate reductase
MVHVKIYNTVSLDGYMTDVQGSFDWVAEGYSNAPFLAECSSCDAVVLGRGAYESYLQFQMWPLPAKQLFVLTSSLPISPDFSQLAGEPSEVLRALENKGLHNILLVGGGHTNSAFLQAGLVKQIVLDVQPVMLGSGVKLFEPMTHVELQLLKNEQHGPVAHLEFEVVATPALA